MFPNIWKNRHEERLHQRLLELRKGYFGPVEFEQILDLQYKAETFLAVAGCFGRQWERVVFLALTTSKPKNLLEDDVKKLRDKLSASVSLPKLPRSSDPNYP